MKLLITMFIMAMIIAISCQECDRRNPYSLGSHWNYSIECRDGMLYRYESRGHSGFVTPCLHSNGKQMKCGENRH
jgi:hypothetical protein